MEELLLLMDELLASNELEEISSLDDNRAEELLSATDETVSDDSDAEEDESTGPEVPLPSQATRNKAKEIARKVIRIPVLFSDPTQIRSLHNGLDKRFFYHPCLLRHRA